ncbi:hypothetical protein [Streptomyces sp. NPDC058694]
MIQTNDRSTTQRRDEQEMFVLCLRILQSTLVYVKIIYGACPTESQSSI